LVLFVPMAELKMKCSVAGRPTAETLRRREWEARKTNEGQQGH
jgi:ribosomal protein L37E